jgi:uncharacterized protein (UPF0335 family)
MRGDESIGLGHRLRFIGKIRTAAPAIVGAPRIWGYMADEERGEGMGGGRVAADELRLLIERAERLEEEKRGLADDIKDVMGEAKSRGYDTKAIRKIMAIRKKKKDEYQEEEAILETYLHALGMI